MRKLISLIIALLLSMITLSSFADNDNCSKNYIARRGCCSWHGGVCGCSGGRQVCCDGQFSPSCRCKKDQYKNDEQQEKILKDSNKGIKS